MQPSTNICPQLFGVNYVFGALDVKPLLVLCTYVGEFDLLHGYADLP